MTHRHLYCRALVSKKKIDMISQKNIICIALVVYILYSRKKHVHTLEKVIYIALIQIVHIQCMHVTSYKNV